MHEICKSNPKIFCGDTAWSWLELWTTWGKRVLYTDMGRRGCFGLGRTAALHKTHYIVRKDHYVKNIEATLQGTSQEVKDWTQIDNDSNHYKKTTKSVFWSGHHNALISVIHEKFVRRAENVSAGKAAYKSGSVAPILSGGTAQSSRKLLWEACGRKPRMSDPSQTG